MNHSENVITGAFFLLACVLALLIVSMLPGCATQMAALKGYENSALVGIRAAEDNNIGIWTVNACGTPLSAMIRNPQIVPALRDLCLPAGSASNPEVVLGAIPSQSRGDPPVAPTASVLNALPVGTVIKVLPGTTK